MRHLMHYMRQLNQRRMYTFHLMPSRPSQPVDASLDLLLHDRGVFREDRARSLREMFAEIEYEDNDDDPR